MPGNENSTENQEEVSGDDRTAVGAVGPNFGDGEGIGGQPFAEDWDGLFKRIYDDMDWGATPDFSLILIPFAWTQILVVGGFFLGLSVGSALFFVFGNGGEYAEAVSLEIASACFFLAAGPVVMRWARMHLWSTILITLSVGIGLLCWGYFVSNKLQSALIEFGVATLMLVILELSFSPIWKAVMRMLRPETG